MAASWYRASGGAFEVDVLAVPRSSRSRVAGVHDGRLKVQLAAPPADGEANAALVALFSELLSLKRSAISLVAGHGARQKRLRIEGTTEAALEALAK
ncbi:DUF167 domain-containing protein [Myxococcota bacterium]|nr:DUF167 domain-containing protein [Myxococcota bacterium]